ncbi:hypothetical protein D3C73_1092000 [compost metagenome]
MSTPFELVISRTIQAPRERVFKAFIDAKHLQQWWGPNGYEMHVSKSDLRPDGIFHYKQRSPEGEELWAKLVYKEIVEPEKIVFTNSFANEEGQTIRAPFSSTWPLEILNNFTFEEVDGQTTLTMRSVPVSPTVDELQTFEASQEMLQIGFGGTLDQLADYLTKM